VETKSLAKKLGKQLSQRTGNTQKTFTMAELKKSCTFSLLITKLSIIIIIIIIINLIIIIIIIVINIKDSNPATENPQASILIADDDALAILNDAKQRQFIVWRIKLGSRRFELWRSHLPA
jgi:uncharacterized membrane protein YvbJ